MRVGGASFVSALSILDNCDSGWIKPQKIVPKYQSLICNNLIERITSTWQQPYIFAEDPLLLEIVLRDEKLALGALQSFLDDLYDIDSESCSSPLPPLPPSPLLVTFKSSFKHFVTSGKRVFHRYK
ncbi:hypothetical protein BJ165DRAFT_1532167 [Panaeolus papilionaceus]|nr:hypothetical protein BJ165DRAFT_1532167 [Panaeolus papilionaceus]